jgi:hypothetical protein
LSPKFVGQISANLLIWPSTREIASLFGLLRAIPWEPPAGYLVSATDTNKKAKSLLAMIDCPNDLL